MKGQGGAITWALNNSGGAEILRGSQKIPTISHVHSSIQYICFRKTSGSKMGVVIARRPKRLAQLRSVSHALVSTLQKHWSKTSKLMRFGSLNFRNNWGWPCTAVGKWLICSNRKLYNKNEKPHCVINLLYFIIRAFAMTVWKSRMNLIQSLKIPVFCQHHKQQNEQNLWWKINTAHHILLSLFLARD